MEQIELKKVKSDKPAKSGKSIRFRFIHFTALFVIFSGALIIISLSTIFVRGETASILENLSNEEVLFAIQLSLWTSAISTILCLLVAIPVAYTLARAEFRGKTIVNTLVDLPMALPPLIAGLGLLLLFGTTAVGDFFRLFGIKFVFTVWGVLIAQFFVNLPLATRIMRSIFFGIDPRYEYVAKTLGCTGREAFQKVALPMAKDGIFASFTLTFARAMGEFGATLMIAGSIRMETETLPISVYLNMTSGHLELAIAAAIILVIISVVSLYVCEKLTGSPRIF